MATLERAIELAAHAHAGQMDDQGEPYILHPLRLMQSLTDSDARIVAVLHDVIEDTEVTLEELQEAGFSITIIDAVRVMTKESGMNYRDYVVRLADNSLAKQVKLADLRDNARLDRALIRRAKITKDFKRLHRYHLSYQFLEGNLTESEYRKLMATAER